MSKWKKIPALESGDEIRIVSVASAVEKVYIENTIDALQKLGFKASLGEHVYASYNQFAGTDEQRTLDMQIALDDSEVKAIFCARGGYGSVRIIDKLNFSNFKKSPKWLVGFSDVTVFHALLNQGFEIPTLHAPMPVNYSSEFFKENLQQLNQLLRGELQSLHVEPHPLNNKGLAKGQLVGGNLSILYSLQATPYALNADEKILFIEDVGEQLYHLDRMMQNFRLSGKFAKLKGLIVGGLTGMQDKKRPFGRTAEEIIAEQVEGMDIPVVFNFPAGHIENNIPFVLGGDIELIVEDEVKLEYL